MTFSYCFEEAPLPLDNYLAMVTVVPLSGQNKAVIQWRASFKTREPDPQGQHVAAVNELIVSGHKSLQCYLGTGQAN